MTLNSTNFFIGLILLIDFQVAVVLEIQLENEMPAPAYNTSNFETDLQYSKRHQEKLIETQLNEFENNVEDGKIKFNLLKETDNLRDQQIHDNLEYNTLFLSKRAVGVFTEPEKLTVRKTRSVANNSTELDDQFEKFCSSVGSQPCTCYYPDHQSIPQFHLGIDELTKNASSLNGTGPGNCQDLKVLGNKLEGFYLVRFNPKRIKTIYCDFNNGTVINTKKQEQDQEETYSKEGFIGRSSKTIIQFCGGVQGKQCTYLYSDHPDASQMGNIKLLGKEPSSCKDLSLIGHILQGFYMVRLNTIKVIILYCDFKNQARVGNKKGANTESISNLDSKSEPFYCNGLGSQPCSCYYSNSPNILQFELSNDEKTSKALIDNGPSSCEDLKTIGYNIKGFYMVRSNAKILKTIFCEFCETSMEKNNPYPDSTMMSSSSKTIQIEDQTTPKKLNTEKYVAGLQTTLSTLKPQIQHQNSENNPVFDTVSIDGSSKTTPVIRNHGTFYLLKNKRDKCMSSEKLNLFGPYESDCNPKDKNQHWKWCGDKNICNHQDKLLSTIFTSYDLNKNGKKIKKFNIRLLILQQSSHVYQKWRLTGSGQLEEIENGLCLGVAYGSFYQQYPLLTVDSCDQNDSGQFWSFEIILTPSLISTSRPQAVGFDFPEKSSSTVIKSSQIIPLTQKDGNSYLLKNKRNKCMYFGPLSQYGPHESSCDPKDKYQHWKWCSDNKLCNHLGQSLSKEYFGESVFLDGKTEKMFNWKLLGLSKYVDQNWRATDVGQLIDSKYGLCLGVAYNSADRQHLLITVKPCNEKDDAQFWSFENIWNEVSSSRSNSKSPIIESTKLIPLNQKDGKSYHLINKHNKCISSKSVDKFEVTAVQSPCNPTEKRQLWKWSGESLCSDFGCLSKVHQEHDENFKVLLGEEKYDSPWVNQNWTATDQGQILSSSGLCLGVETDSDFQDVILILEICNQNRKSQIWSFTTI